MIFKSTLLVVMLQVFCLNVVMAAQSTLRISNGTTFMEMRQDGNLVSNVELNAGAIPPDASGFTLKKGTATQMVIRDQGIAISGSLNENDLFSSTTGNLVFKYSTTSVAQLSSNAVTLALKGTNLGPYVLNSAVGYAGNAVFTTKVADGPLVCDYVNLGGDGKTVYNETSSPEQNFFYVKDHLGSTRMVYSEVGIISDVTDYKPYGKIVKLNVEDSTATKSREKFTGKEFDTEGAKRGSQVKHYVKLSLGFGGWSDFFVSYKVTYNDGSYKSREMLRYLSDSPYDESYFLLDVWDYNESNQTIKDVALIFYHRYLPPEGVSYVVPLNFTTNVDKSRTIQLTKNFSDIYLSQTETTTLVNYFTTTSEVAFNGLPGISLDYFGKRYYDAEIGRWTSVDPMGQYNDAYLYGGNDPVNRVDPDGGIDGMAMKQFFRRELWYQAKVYKEQAPVALLRGAENTNNAVNTATNVGAILSPEPSSKAGFLLANTVSDVTAVGIDLAQVAIGDGGKSDVAVSFGGFLAGKGIGKLVDRFFGALSPTAKNANQFRNLETGHFSKTSTGKMGQNIDAAAGQVVNAAQDKVSKK